MGVQMKEKIISFLHRKETISYFIILVVATFCCIPLFSEYMNISIDDGIQHIYRLIGTASSIEEGQLFPVIMSDFCNGFGYSWNLFYSPLTAYAPLIFSVFTNSYVVCLKLFIFLTMALSGVFMYKLVYRISSNHIASVISAIIYIATPYHLTDLYNRMAIAELTSFMFLPIIFLGMYELVNTNRKTYYLIIGAIGLLLTHNVITIYTAIFCVVYLLIHYKKLKEKKVLIHICVSIIVLLLCTSFYWIPLLEHYCATTYEVFVPERMYDNETIISTKSSILELIYSRKWGMNLYIGIPIILGTILTFIFWKKIDEKYKKEVSIFLIFGLVSIIMMLKIFPFEHLPNFFKMIQFVWRMLTFTTFFLSVVSGISIAILIEKTDKGAIAFIAIFVICTSFVVSISRQTTKEPFNENEYLSPVPVNSETLRVHAGCATFEYLPTKAFNKLDYIKTRISGVILLQGNANIINENKNGTNMNFEIENASNNLEIELPYIYYLGYRAYITDEFGNKKELEIKESDNGFCMINILNIEKGAVQIKYEGTALMKVSYVLSLAGAIVLVAYICKNKHNVV